MQGWTDAIDTDLPKAWDVADCHKLLDDQSQFVEVIMLNRFMEGCVSIETLHFYALLGPAATAQSGAPRKVVDHAALD